MRLPEELERLAVDQLAVVSRRQILDCGVPVGTLRWQLGRSWRLLLPGVVLLHPGQPTADQRLSAALLLAGPESWLAGATAAALHGITKSEPGEPVHVLVPAPRTPRQVGWVSIRRTHLLDERIVERGCLRFSCRARSVVDAAADARDPAAARALIISALQRRLVRLDDVQHWVEARRPNGRLVLRRAVAEAAAGAWSVPEADLARLLGRSRSLPPAWANPELTDAQGCRLTSPDLWLDDVGLAIMVHSREYHEADLDWDSTVERDTDLSSCRIIVVGVTPGSIAREPERVLARIETAYAAALASGTRPNVTATQRTTGLLLPA